MLRKFSVLLLVSVMGMSLAACDSSGAEEKNAEKQEQTVPETKVEAEQTEEQQPAEELAADGWTEDTPAADTETEGELQPPVMEWWDLYNPNGYDTVTAVISNPNDRAIDVSYSLVFYKDGTEVSRIEYCGNSDILPGHRDIIWANADVPSAADADEVRMEDVAVTEAYDPAIDGTYEYAGIIDGDACYDFTFDSKPTMATVWLVEYNDNNGNGQLDKGEIVVANMDSLFEQEDRASYNVDVYPHTGCEVFFTAY